MAQVIERSQTYVLGHSPGELRRLNSQAAILRPYTERLLRAAGVGAGMRVLDAGCGTGDVTLLAADFVGPTGSVDGIDRSPEALATARAGADVGGYRRVTFHEGDIAAIDEMGPYDAVIGRFVLAYQPDPIAALRNLARQVRPGGIVAFAEFVLLPAPMEWPERPLLRQVVSWITQGIQRSGAQRDMGLQLHSTFTGAGLPAPDVRLDAIPMSGAERALLAWPVDTLRSMLPAIERFGIASASEVEIDTLLDRLIDEASSIGGTSCGVFVGTAWANKA